MKKNKFPNPWGVKPLKFEEDDSIISRRKIVKKPQPLKKPEKRKKTYCVIIKRVILDYYYVDSYDADDAVDIVYNGDVDPDESEEIDDTLEDVRDYA